MIALDMDGGKKGNRTVVGNVNGSQVPEAPHVIRQALTFLALVVGESGVGRKGGASWRKGAEQKEEGITANRRKPSLRRSDEPG